MSWYTTFEGRKVRTSAVHKSHDGVDYITLDWDGNPRRVQAKFAGPVTWEEDQEDIEIAVMREEASKGLAKRLKAEEQMKSAPEKKKKKGKGRKGDG